MSVHLPVIYYTPQTSPPAPSERWCRHCLHFFLRSPETPHRRLWRVVWYADQTGKPVETDSSVTARAAPLPLLQSQPLTVVILAWFKGLLHCRQEKRAISSALSSISCGEALLLWVMPELWLTDYGGINKYNLILIKSDKVCWAAREWRRPSPPWYTNRRQKVMFASRYVETFLALVWGRLPSSNFCYWFKSWRQIEDKINEAVIDK